MDIHTPGPATAEESQPNAGRRTDAVILEIAGGQHGVVTRRQLADAGVRGHAIDYRLRVGRLQAVHRGVYRTGPVKGRHERHRAAVLACGAGAVLSHRTAAGLWELAPPPRPGAMVDVTLPRGRRGPGRGVRLHRVARLEADEVGRRHGLPITSPARTLLDIASCASTRELERALAHAERRRIADRAAVEAVLGRNPRRRGARALRTLLQTSGSPALTRSDAEARFLALVRRADLPRPHTNVVVQGLEVDFLWRDEALVVEIDGFAYHGGRDSFERDRRRDSILTAAGFRVVRFTWRQLTDEPEAVLVRVAQALAALGRQTNGVDRG